MKPILRIVGWVLALLIPLAIVVPLPTASADSTKCAHPGKSDDPDAVVTKRAVPVILVHGWDSEAPFMDPVEKGLHDRLHKDVTLLRFNYKQVGDRWASHPDIAGCLADYIDKVSKARVHVGGDPRVLLVTHSMGGLAARFASSSKFADDPSMDKVAGVVTIGAPSLGSPFANNPITRGFEMLQFAHSWRLPEPESQAWVCLALHNRHQPLPKGCKTAPYYENTVPVTQVGGNISVRRKLFGFDLYDIDLASDGIVGVDSSLGYVGSGPVGEKTPSGSRLASRRIDCTMPLKQVVDAAAALGFISNPNGSDFLQFVSSLNTHAYSDMEAMKQLGGGYGSLQLFQLMLAANVNANCSHLNIVKNDDALNATSKALRVWINQLRAEEKAKAAREAQRAMEPWKGDWYRHRTALNFKSNGTAIETGDLEIRSTNLTPQGRGTLDLPPKLVGTVDYVSDGTEYRIHKGSRIEFKMDTPETIWVTYGNGYKRLQFCLDGAMPPGNECGA